jgi:hypothetical protein
MASNSATTPSDYGRSAFSTVGRKRKDTSQEPDAADRASDEEKESFTTSGVLFSELCRWVRQAKRGLSTAQFSAWLNRVQELIDSEQDNITEALDMDLAETEGADEADAEVGDE